jgi:hypothetical protein
MKLLSLQQVTEKNAIVERDRKARVANLNQEESDAVQRLNIALDTERKNKERIATEEAQLQKDHDAKVAALKSEIEALEERKKAAQAKTNVTLEEAATIKKENEQYQIHLIDRIKKADEKSELYTTKFEELSDREQLMTERETGLDKRESKIAATEASLKTSTDELNGKWLEFHKTVHAQNEQFTEREKKIRDGTKVNDNIREELKRKEEGLNDRDRFIRSQYESLQITLQEINNKK